MSPSQKLAASHLLVGLAAGVYQYSAGFPDLDSGIIGPIFAAIFVIVGLGTWVVALLKSYEVKQIRWLVALLFVWPLMYLYVFFFAKPAKY